MTRHDEHLRVASQISAEQAAAQLFSLASAVYPNTPDLLNLFTKQILDTTIVFAIHTRKYMELTGASDTRITASRWRYDLNQGCEIEDSFRRAINTVIHSQTAKVHFSPSPTKMFTDSKAGECVALHIVAQTDKYPEVYIDLFGLAWAFLSVVNNTPERSA